MIMGLEHLIVEKFLDIALPNPINPTDFRASQFPVFDVIQDGERVQLQYFADLFGSEDAILHNWALKESNFIRSDSI